MNADDKAIDQLQELILGAPRIHTRDEVASISGMPLEQARELWRAMGFADVGDARAFTDADLTAVLRMRGLVERGLIDKTTAVDVARSLGQTTARLADWQVDALGRRMARRGDVDLSDGLQSDELDAIREETTELLPVLEQLLVYVWRRQLAAVIGRRVADVDDRVVDGDLVATVAFADLVGFTRLSRQLEDAELAALVERFETSSADVVAATGARLVKTLGDEVLFVADGPAQAAETALRLHETHRRDPDVPQMRVGLATGDVVTRMGDVFGATVNLASRLTALARPGTTLVDAASAHLLDDDEAFHLRPLAPRPVRGVGLVRAFALTRG